MIKEYKDYSHNIEESCDVCVIGSGAGGAVAAKELAEKGYSVILLEEGGNYTQKDWNGKPCYSLPKMWRNGGFTLSLGTPAVSVTLGKGIGGTTTVNSATCFRTPDSVLEMWQQNLGLDNLTKQNLEPYFSKVEREINVTDLSWEVLGKCAKVIKDGAEVLGLNCRPLKHNVKNCRGCGTCQFGCLDGAKQSMDVTYIPKAIEAGAKVYSHCKAERCIIENKKVKGVRCLLINPETGKPVFEMKVSAKVVIVACGTMITPTFLKKSGLKNKNLGRHLQIHPCTRVAAIMGEEVEGWKGVSQGVYIDDFEDEGIMLEGIFVHPSLLLAAFPGVGHSFKENVANFKNIAAFGVMVHDSTTGRVFKSGKDFIFSTYFIKKSDSEKLKKGIAYVAKLFFAAGAKKVLTPIYNMPELNSEADIKKLMKLKMKPNHLAEAFAFHPLGTCRMAHNKKMGAVNKDGETFEIENLYVADGSIVPTSLGVNPQVTIMTLATKIAEGIAMRLSGELKNASGL